MLDSTYGKDSKKRDSNDAPISKVNFDVTTAMINAGDSKTRDAEVPSLSVMRAVKYWDGILYVDFSKIAC